MKTTIILFHLSILFTVSAGEQTILYIQNDEATTPQNFTLLKLKMDECGVPTVLREENFVGEVALLRLLYPMVLLINGIVLVDGKNPVTGGIVEVIKINLKPDGTGSFVI